MIPFSLLMLIVLISLIIVNIWIKLHRFCKKYEKLPQEDSHFLMGHASIFVKSFLGLCDKPLHAVAFEFFNNLLENNRDLPYGLFWLGWYPIITVMHPKYIEKLLNNSHAIEKAPEYHYLHAWLGTGLLTSGGHKWKERRRMLSPAFHFKILNDFVPIINEQSQILIQKLTTTVGQEIDVFDYIPYATLDTICETAMGVKIHAQSNPKSSYVNAVMLQSEIIFSRIFNPLVPDWLFYRTSAGKKHTKSLEILHNFTRNVIREKIQERSSFTSKNINDLESSSEEQIENLYLSSRKRLAFMDLLVDAYLKPQDSNTLGQEAKINFEGIREEVDTFMFEGFDTTAAAVSWIIFLLGHNQQCQDKLFEEIDEIFSKEHQSKNVNQKFLTQFKYLEACVKEGLRLFPSVPMIARKLTQDIQFDDHILPKNTTAAVYLYGLHRDEKVFPNPECFIPERFLEESVNCKRHAFAYLPFSAGPRNCIGQKFAMIETKTLILYMVRHYRIQSTVPLKDVDICIELITRPKSKLGVILTPR